MRNPPYPPLLVAMLEELTEEELQRVVRRLAPYLLAWLRQEGHLPTPRRHGQADQ